MEPHNASVAERIAAVESSLDPTVRIDGQPNVSARLGDRMAFYRVPGLALAVIDKCGIDWSRGYGMTDADTGGPVDQRTLFQAASISKPVAALGAVHLVERGVLALDRDVNELLRTWHLPENEFTANDKVTLRRLLSHSGGLSVRSVPGYQPGEALPTVQQILDGVPPATNAPVRVELTPGRQFRYSGGGSTLAQLLIMDATGRSFEEFMRGAVLDATGMSNSTFRVDLPGPLLRRAATGHDDNGRPLPGRWRIHPESAAAGLWTTPTDLARFAIELQDAYSGRSRRVVSRQYAHEILSPQIDEIRGLGPWLSSEPRRFFHGGGNSGFRCKLVADVEGGRGAVVMTNGDGGTILIDEVLNAVARAYGWPAFVPVRTAVSLAPDTLERCVGDYAGTADYVIRIRRKGNRLFGSAANLAPSELHAESEGVFFPLEIPLRLVFDGVGDQSSQVAVHGDGIDLVALRVES